MAIDRFRATVAALALLGLAGCAAHPARLAEAPPPPAVATAVPMPQPPAGSYAGMTIPGRLVDGSYATPNRDLTAAAAVWHLRVALNVAALGCRGPQGDTITAAYNAMLDQQKSALSTAHDRLIAQSGGQVAYDEAMTQLYNYFAQPAAKASFCAAAAIVVGQLGAGGSLDAAAAPALAALDAAFVDFYRSYDTYRTQLASWQADRLHRALQPVDETPQVALAAAAPAPIAERQAVRSGAPHLPVDPAIFRLP